MKTTQTTVVEVGDIIYVIDNHNKINKITLSENHLKQDNSQTFVLTKPYYKLKTNKVKNGTLELIKAEHHDDYDRWDPYRVVHEWYTYEKTDRVAYLNIKDAQNKVRELTNEEIVLSRVTEELFCGISTDVESILEEVALYFETLDMNGLRGVAELTETHQTIKLIDEKLKELQNFSKD